MINILHVITNLDVGGAENLILAMVKNMDRTRYNASICCISHAGVLAAEFEKMGVRVLSLGLMKKKGWDGKIITAIEDVIKNEHIDVLHTHLYHANLFGSLAAKHCKTPSVMSIQNTYSHHKLHRRILNWYVSRFVRTIIVGSEDIKRDVMKNDWVASSKITVIDNCVDLDVIKSKVSREEMREQLSIPEGAVVLGTIGRLEEQKGHRFLIQALKLLCESEIQFFLVLVGEGKKRDELERLVEELSLQERVMFLGTRTDIGDLLMAMDIFIMPSLWEGLSLSMLTAMAAEKPVIATNVGGVKKVLGDDEYGLVIESGKPEAIVYAIEKILNDKHAVKNKLVKAKALVYERYSAQSMVKSLEQIYSSMMI